MNTVTTKSLEARLCMETDTPCALCERHRDRTIGMTETYLAGTEDWICCDCATALDPDLANFAYAPELLGTLQKKHIQPEYYGVCPQCGRGPGRWLNVYKSHWLVCLRHGLCWNIGENIFSSWRDETEEVWKTNIAILRRMREVEICRREPTRSEQLSDALRNFLTGVWQIIVGR